MSLEEYLSQPWKKSHLAYEGSSFNIRPAPEFATSEVLVASSYRAAGYQGYAETEVPKAGREFDKQTTQAKPKKDAQAAPASEFWASVLHLVLESPKQPNQSSKRFLSLTPLVPEICLYSGSARLAGNSWNPGALVQKMVQLGAESQLRAEEIWDSLWEGLSVASDDDIWARWLQDQFQQRQKSAPEWRRSDLPPPPEFPERTRLTFPARQFVGDLEAILKAKESMTRRQWISMLEGVIRLAAVAHVIWLCQINDRLWRSVAAVLRHGSYSPPTSEEEVRDRILNGDYRTLSYGNAAMPMIRDLASSYLVARLGLNIVLWGLEKVGVRIESLNSSREIWRLINEVDRQKEKLFSLGAIEKFIQLRDDESRTINCKKGIGSNLVEFARHSLGQRQTLNESLRGYDQGYFLHKRGENRNAPWVLSFGPVAVLAIVHCCLYAVKGPRSVHRLIEHLAKYGIEVDADDINISDLGRKLRMLGLVLDSPDAETGMLLVPPFALSA